MNIKTHSWPENHWHWPVQLTHYHGVKRGGLIYTGGQADLDKSGNVGNPENLTAQTNNVVQFVEDILQDFEASLKDVLKFVIYFTGDAEDEAEILNIIASRLPTNVLPAVSTICLPALCYPGMRIELEAIAVDTQSEKSTRPRYLRSNELAYLHPRYSHVVCCNQLLWTSDMSSVDNEGNVLAPNDVISQTRLMMEQLDTALKLGGITADNVLKVNVFYEGDGTAKNWEEPAKIRADFFREPGPAATGIAVTSFANPSVKTKMAVTAHLSVESSPKVIYAWPENHWDWTTHLPYKHGNRFGDVIHLGGQVALDTKANVLEPGDIVEQTKIAMKNIETVLAEYGASLDDIVKVTTFYQGGSSSDELHKNLMIRSNSYKTPGPATSGIPVPHLVYKNMMIEIEVIAIARN